MVVMIDRGRDEEITFASTDGEQVRAATSANGEKRPLGTHEVEPALPAYLGTPFGHPL